MARFFFLVLLSLWYDYFLKEKKKEHSVAYSFGVQIGLSIHSLKADKVGWQGNKIIVDKLK